MIIEGFDHVSKTTCIKFFPKKPEDKFFINVTRESETPGFPNSCRADNIGFNGTYLEGHYLRLGDDQCIQFGIIVHEIGHVIGLEHEQGRTGKHLKKNSFGFSLDKFSETMK